MQGALERALLLLNHLLVSEPEARTRLLAHVGRRLDVNWQVPAGPWPVPPKLALLVTPAGLFESLPQAAGQPSEQAADLRVIVELVAPHRMALRWLTGERAKVAVDGDARLAADVAWLADNLRWDAEADLARWVGGAWAHEILRLARAAREALRPLAERAAGLAGEGDTHRAASR